MSFAKFEISARFQFVLCLYKFQVKFSLKVLWRKRSLLVNL